MQAWQAVIFDLDDTLYPERQYVSSGLQAVAEWIEQNLGIDRSTAYTELWGLFESGLRGNLFDLWLERYGFDTTQIVPTLVQVYRDHRPHIQAYPEARDLLAQLHATGIPVGLLSDGYLETQRKKLSALGIEHYFSAIVFSDEIGRDYWKPSPVPFLTLFSRLGVAPTAAVYVADNPLKDFAGARQLGVHTVRMRLLEGLYSQLEPPSEAHRADVEVTSYSQLSELLVRYLQPSIQP